MVAAAVVLFVLIAPPAEAGELTFRTIEYPGVRGGLIKAVVATYVAGPGERNVVHVRYAGRRLRIRDVAGVRAGPRCRTEVDGATTCRVARHVVELEARLADGDDELSGSERSSLDVDGGEGDDRITGFGRLVGGPGSDELQSRCGGVLSGGPGADLLDPGCGATLDYSERTAGVAVDMRGDTAAGEPGEGDRVLPGASWFRGGSGPDRAHAPESGGTLDGGAGDDQLIGGALAGNGAYGGAGDDWLVGGARYDRLEGGLGSDVVVGGGGDDELFADGGFPSTGRDDRDQLYGDAGEDYLLGARGDDTLDGGEGRDLLIGEGGVDRLLARDRSADDVLCAGSFDGVPVPGHDLALLDRRDDQRSCGLVERTGPPAAELLGAEDVRSERRRHGGVLRVYVGCPAITYGCDAVIRIVVYRHGQRRCAVRLPPGARRRVRFTFDLRAAGVRSGGVGIEVRLSSPKPSGRLRRQKLSVDSEWPKPLLRQAPPGGGTISAPLARCRR